MVYAVTIFLSSFLLFLVQPLIARLILPWFGGTAAVWTTCMLFFQSLLLAGYLYAHAANTRLGPRAQAILHTLLLAAAVLLLPIAPGEAWKPQGDEEPVGRILLVLLVSVGLPYFLLASTSPMVQAWFARARPGENPYRLFALSNLASLLALIGYPLAIEPVMGGGGQVAMWSWLFAAFAAGCAVAAWSAARLAPPRALPSAGVPAADGAAADGAAAKPPTRADLALWTALSATGSVLLLAVTNHLTQNVAAIPLLWVAPLTLYLLSFIVTFEGSLYRPQWFWSVVPVWLAGMAWLLVDADRHFDLALQLGMYLSGLFVACVFCHGELYRLRPAARHLTVFYVTVSAGGALGGVLVAIVAPLVFTGYYELGLALVAVAVLAAVRYREFGRVAAAVGLAAVFGVSASALYDGLRFQRNTSVSERNFYGTLRIREYGREGEEGHLRRLMHGVILHGEQYMTGERSKVATTYYSPASGIGLAIASLAERPAIRVGVIGLGVGTLAVYGRPGDTYRFYDINPAVIEMAKRDFTYLRDSRARIEIALGDARLVLEREASQDFDILAVDAFSSDAIPVHLITREALAVYLRHTRPDGIVAFHVSNRFLELAPVVARAARELGAHVRQVANWPEDEDSSGTDWVLVSRDPAALRREILLKGGAAEVEERPRLRTWTDDYSNLLQVLK